ncbi:interferon omega-1-like [Brachyhypopomus gauderio]|uniref:interferon omega-1-like n=1 Tax=Brachyhypopomus gauderio TaxID=698409 RepID=UPI004041894C
MRDAENMKIPGKTDLEFPKEMKTARLVLEVSFRSALELFEKNTTSTSWDARELQHLKHLLGQQSDCYKQDIMVISPGQDVIRWSRVWTRLGDVLSEKNFSSCAWETVRPVVLRIMRIFSRSISNSSKRIPR